MMIRPFISLIDNQVLYFAVCFSNLSSSSKIYQLFSFARVCKIFGLLEQQDKPCVYKAYDTFGVVHCWVFLDETMNPCTENGSEMRWISFQPTLTFWRSELCHGVYCQSCQLEHHADWRDVSFKVHSDQQQQEISSFLSLTCTQPPAVLHDAVFSGVGWGSDL